MKQSINISQSQTLVMTQQLQQSIKLLQMSSAELQEFVADEIEKNPLLCDAEDGDIDADAGVGAEVGGEEYIATSGDGLADTAAGGDSDRVENGVDSIDGSSFDDGYYYDSYPPSSHSAADDDFVSDIIEQRVSGDKTLREHLLEQVSLDARDDTQLAIATYLIDMLDENGYMREEISDIARQLNCSDKDISSAIELLQQCDPVGVGATNLAECLKLQLIDKGRYDKRFEHLINNLQLVEVGEMKKLQRICGVSEEELQNMLQEMQRLNPYPASGFVHEPVQVIAADIIVRKVSNKLPVDIYSSSGNGGEDRRSDNKGSKAVGATTAATAVQDIMTAGEWHVELNNDVLPKALVNRKYHAELIDRSRDKSEKKFLNEQLANANWLVKAMDQRAENMLKVATEIVRQQRKFFEYGVRFLRPMTLGDVAKNVGLHESSVSRITSNKYLSSERGIFELKYFFSSAISGAFGDGKYSSRSVMDMIREVIDAETVDNIMSDDAIAEALKARGVDVARRTVVKYRKKMGIPSSIQRRREKRR